MCFNRLNICIGNICWKITVSLFATNTLRVYVNCNSDKFILIFTHFLFFSADVIMIIDFIGFCLKFSWHTDSWQLLRCHSTDTELFRGRQKQPAKKEKNSVNIQLMFIPHMNLPRSSFGLPIQPIRDGFWGQRFSRQTKLKIWKTPQFLWTWGKSPLFCFDACKVELSSLVPWTRRHGVRRRGLPEISRFLIKRYVVNWKRLAAPYCIPLRVPAAVGGGGTVRPLCCAPGEAYHFTPTCRHRPAQGA